jgi:ubiquinol-cytochrome c reductase iron-sulfur subunit
VSATEDSEPSRRDFLYIATGAVGVVGVGFAVWPLIHQMNPDASVQALASIEVNLEAITEGQSITVMWRGKPVFIRHRTAEEIAEAEAVELDVLPDPQTDADRVQQPQWLIMVGICTHLGCVPLGQKPGGQDYNGWFCPCHGSHYDTSGRIRKGPGTAQPAGARIPVPDRRHPDRLIRSDSCFPKPSKT